MTDRRVLATGDQGAIKPAPRRRRSDLEALEAVPIPEQQAADAAGNGGKPCVYRLLAANLDSTSDGGCDLIFVSDEEAMAFARQMSEFAACIQVWSGTRLVGLACSPRRQEE